MKKFFLLIITFFSLPSINASIENLNFVESISIYSGDINTMTGPENELNFYKNFPTVLYKTYKVLGIGSFYLDQRVDIIKNQLRNGIPWEIEIIDLINQHAKINSTVVDIGAHIGTHTLTMSKLVGSNGKVIAFEPQIKLYSELIMNMELNQRINVICYRCTVGDSFGLVEMNPPVIDNEGGTKIGFGGDSAYMITLDSLNLKDVSLVKIDVENAELNVLKGARNTILTNQPVIIVEIMGNIYQPIENREDKVEEILQYIKSLGYSLSYIKGSWSDWLAIPKINKTLYPEQ